MFEVNSKYKVADGVDDHGGVEPLSTYYHLVSYEWDMPLFFVTYDVIDSETGDKSRLMVQAAGTLGLFAILKFHEAPIYRIRYIELRYPQPKNISAPWQTKMIVEAYEGQVVANSQIMNGVRFHCEDSTIIFDPPDLQDFDTNHFQQCISVHGGYDHVA